MIVSIGQQDSLPVRDSIYYSIFEFVSRNEQNAYSVYRYEASEIPNSTNDSGWRYIVITDSDIHKASQLIPFLISKLDSSMCPAELMMFLSATYGVTSWAF
mgnify:CR=1 FL=1